MGYMRHHAIIVTSWDHNALDAALHQAVLLGNTCTTISVSPTNDYRTFVVVPDGSKEGWEDSDKGDLARYQLRCWIADQEDGGSRFSWAEVMYGDEEGELSVRGRR